MSLCRTVNFYKVKADLVLVSIRTVTTLPQEHLSQLLFTLSLQILESCSREAAEQVVADCSPPNVTQISVGLLLMEIASIDFETELNAQELTVPQAIQN